MRKVACAAVVLVGCGGSGAPPPVPIAFGDCAPAEVAWVMGPHPLPFTNEEAHGVFARLPPEAAVPPTEAPASPDALPDDVAKLLAPEDPADLGPGPFDDLDDTGGVARLRGDGPRVGTAGGWRPGAGASSDEPVASGELDKVVIRRVIRSRLSEIRECYERALSAHAALAGSVTATFFVAQDGAVTGATTVGLDAAPEVGACVARELGKLHFPAPRGGGGVLVHYAFAFRTAGGDDASDVPAAPLAGAGAGAPASPPAAPPPAAPRVLFRAEPLGWALYHPGEDNPLRAESAALAACLRGAAPHGGAVIELHYRESGEVADARAYGVDDEGVRACLVAAARRVKRGGTTLDAQRCAFAFGAQPAAALPTYAVTGAAVTFGGAAVADDGKGPHARAIVDEVAARARIAAAAGGPVLVSEGPTVIAPTDATPMAQVERVVGSVIAGGGDAILAVHRPGGVQLLPPWSLPMIPVPFGTGGRWLRVKGRASGMFANDQTGLRLSVLVTRQEIWIGVSRAEQFMRISRDDPAALSDALRTQKASGSFADRTDIEIAGDDDVPYGDVVKVIHEAVRVGFLGWELADPRALAARPHRE